MKLTSQTSGPDGSIIKTMLCLKCQKPFLTWAGRRLCSGCTKINDNERCYNRRTMFGSMRGLIKKKSYSV